MEKNKTEKISPELIEKAKKYYNDYKKEGFVVKPSLPILYFGDIDAYFKSKIKIITVGKNPSNKEFELSKSDKSFIRFPEWDEGRYNLTQVLNGYFENDHPYRRWFNSYEPILNGAGCSFYSKDENYKNRAIHTDMCSPLATEPTWSGLEPGERTKLFKEGFELWKSLLDELKPKIILVSIKYEYFEYFTKMGASNKEELKQFTECKDGKPRKKPYDVYKYDLINETISAKVIYGRQVFQKPFDTLLDKQKKEIGEKLYQKYCIQT